jgi:hypothetical protein
MELYTEEKMKRIREKQRNKHHKPITPGLPSYVNNKNTQSYKLVRAGFSGA